jgi:NADP-dependent 3-hydroxy acid dehydrogenase YdfG
LVIAIKDQIAMQDVHGKTAFITGAASGMGLAMAHSFARAGMKVVIADIEDDALARVADEFEASNREFLTLNVDVTQRDAMERAAEQTLDRFGKVHVLVNNAGVGVGGRLDDMSYNDWDWVLGVNLDGVVNGLQSFLSHIKSHGEGGHVVNTASIAGHLAVPGLGVYNASKFAVVAISETLSHDLQEHDIGVSVLCPGLVDTNIFESGRNRPASMQAETDTADLASSLFGEGTPEERRARLSAMALDPAIVGDMVLHAIEENDLYIFTHPELETSVNQRASGMADAFEKWRSYRESRGL